MKNINCNILTSILEKIQSKQICFMNNYVYVEATSLDQIECLRYTHVTFTALTKYYCSTVQLEISFNITFDKTDKNK